MRPDTSMTADAVRDYVRGVLANHTTQPNVVLSHGHRDHYSLISHVLDGIPVQNIWQGGDPDSYGSDDFPQWIATQVAAGANPPHRNFTPNFHNDENPVGANLDCGDADVFILTVNSGSSENANSLALSIEYENFAVTFTGDAEAVTERQARDNYNGAVRTNVLASSHHGARTRGSNSTLWATATAPEVVIFSSGLRFGHPRCDAVETYTRSVAQVPTHPTHCGIGNDHQDPTDTDQALYVTEMNGRIVVTSNGHSPLSLTCTGGVGCNAQIEH